jgi:hypothetical protein
MEKATHMYDVMRPRGEKGGGHRKAIIAAKFEDCTQNFTRFCLSLRPHLQEHDVQAIADCFGHLITWGNDTGARDKTLDYKLRKSKDMHKSVVDLLTELKTTLEFGTAPPQLYNTR